MKHKTVGKWCIGAGLLLVAAALCLSLWNFREESRAATASAQALREILTQPPASRDTQPEESGSSPEAALPEYLQDPDREMPTVQSGGETYVGVVEIPDLEICLPVIHEWTYPRLKIAPCRYRGSAYANDLILMAHNYPSHFGSLVNLQLGDKVYFTDMAQQVFVYEVVELETLDGSEVEALTGGDWDLTLFTCTIGGQTRVTVRCQRWEAA